MKAFGILYTLVIITSASLPIEIPGSPSRYRPLFRGSTTESPEGKRSSCVTYTHSDALLSEKEQLLQATQCLNNAIMQISQSQTVSQAYISETFDFICNSLMWDPELHEQASVLEKVILQRLEPERSARSLKQVHVGLILHQLEDLKVNLVGHEHLAVENIEVTPDSSSQTIRVKSNDCDNTAAEGNSNEENPPFFDMDD